MKPFIASMVAAGCVAAQLSLVTAGSLAWIGAVAPAMADDHGGGGDDGGDDDSGGDDGGGGGGGGGQQGNASNGNGSQTPSLFKWKKAKKQRAAKPRAKQQRLIVRKAKPRVRKVAKVQVKLLQRARAEIIARNVTAADLKRIIERGYREIARRDLANGRLIVRLRVPRRLSLERARVEVAGITSISQVDFNHYYRPQKDTVTGVDAEKISVGWQISLAQCSGLPTIGVIDSNVDAAHPVLQGAKLETLQIIDKDLQPARDGHGTAVVALIAGSPSGQSPGLLPGVNVFAINVFHQAAENDIRTDAFSLVSAVEELRRRNVKIINMSLTGPANEALEKAIVEAQSTGIFLAAAAGNDGPRAKPLYPAAYAGVVAVTAVDDKQKIYRRAGQGLHVDLAAPGVKVRSAGPNGKVTMHTGSSFAVPFVAAAAALHMRAGGKDAETVIDILNNTALDLGSKGRDSIFGAGLVQLPANCK